MSVRKIQNVLRQLADPDIAEQSKRFFKTGKGEYGEGDQFLGIRVPVLRQQVKVFRQSSLTEVARILKSKYHEERLFALLLLVYQFDRSDESFQKKIYELYLSNTQFINNWDLVDSSAPHIVGAYLMHKNKSPLDKLSHSCSLWERRIAIIATAYFIRQGSYDDTLRLSKRLLKDKEDLIHKAVGWMLREVGKQDIQVETAFLKQHYQKMPRTMLRYAIEKYSKKERQQWLKGTI